MVIRRDQSEQAVITLALPNENGMEQQVVSASSHIRPGKGISINVDVLTAEPLASERYAEMSVELAEFIQVELEKAAATGVPVYPPAEK